MAARMDRGMVAPTMSGALEGTISRLGLNALGGLLLLLCTGCPETWGIDGTMDQAMRKDIQQMGRHDKCPLSDPAERDLRCRDPNEWDRRDCPKGCR